MISGPGHLELLQLFFLFLFRNQQSSEKKGWTRIPNNERLCNERSHMEEN